MIAYLIPFVGALMVAGLLLAGVYIGLLISELEQFDKR